MSSFAAGVRQWNTETKRLHSLKCWRNYTSNSRSASSLVTFLGQLNNRKWALIRVPCFITREGKRRHERYRRALAARNLETEGDARMSASRTEPRAFIFRSHHRRIHLHHLRSSPDHGALPHEVTPTVHHISLVKRHNAKAQKRSRVTAAPMRVNC